MTAPRCTAPIRPTGPRHRLDSPRQASGRELRFVTLPVVRHVVPTVLRSRHLIAAPAAFRAAPVWVVLLVGMSVGALLVMVTVLLFGPASEPGSTPVSSPASAPVDPRA